MEKVKILIVEDELLIAEDIRQQLIKLGYEVSGMAVSYNEALNTIMGHLPDLVLVDINIDGSKDGIELGHFLRFEVDIPFIYLTSNSDEATVKRAKETQPNAYLLKPFKSNSLYTAIEMALSHAHRSNAKTGDNIPKEQDAEQDYILKDCVFVKKDTTYFKIKLNDILYLKTEGNYLYVFSVDGKKHLIRCSMTQFTDFLIEENFFQTHQSFLVNLNFLEEFSLTHVKINGEEIPLSKSRKDDFLTKMRTF